MTLLHWKARPYTKLKFCISFRDYVKHIACWLAGQRISVCQVTYISLSKPSSINARQRLKDYSIANPKLTASNINRANLFMRTEKAWAYIRSHFCVTLQNNSSFKEWWTKNLLQWSTCVCVNVQNYQLDKKKKEEKKKKPQKSPYNNLLHFWIQI